MNMTKKINLDLDQCHRIITIIRLTSFIEKHVNLLLFYLKQIFFISNNVPIQEVFCKI